MDLPNTTLPTPSSQRYRQKSRQPGESSDPAVKPKKVNSEIRKQQNRIASRNYREKRKRKLQYLQQLISDDTDDQSKQPSPEQQDVYAPSHAPDHSIAGPSLSPYRTPANSDLSSVNARRKTSHNLIAPATTTSFNSHHVPTSHAYGAYPSNWSAHPYSPPPPPPANPAWNISSAWTLGFEHTVQPAQHSMYQYSPEPPAPVTYNQAQNLSHQPHEYLSNTYLYGYGSQPGSQHQVTHNPHTALRFATYPPAGKSAQETRVLTD
ncbi:hypothetical protein yc1106_08831 [Curvularia clavata]|uniref:BZIP domain-containing protein n=1 Tax=Curvularia clavata TaxID=95742 RepID=A0A9Q8ZGH9_CURCL|nr:hypothetical protein yc1106_08831 [Curvularia clavata]